ncbi:heat shock factor-binding protein 1 isoform 1-T2 [Dugong dugon]
MAETDPKTVQDLTSVVRGGCRGPRPRHHPRTPGEACGGGARHLWRLRCRRDPPVQTLLQQMQDKFQTMSDQIIGRIDDMSSRIDDLEKNIADLMTQAGVEELEGENKIPATQKS